MNAEPLAEAEPVRDSADVARELLALTILRNRLTDRINGLREDVGEWEPGVTHPLTVPNPDNPRRPLRAGVVRCDQGKVTAEITDQAAFEDWVRQNSAHNIVIEAAHLSGSDTAPAGLLADLHLAYQHALSAQSGPFPMKPEEALWRQLRKAGWTVERAELIPERIYVQPGYVASVLAMSKEEEEPCAPGGHIPAGVTVKTSAAHAYVKPTEDRAIADGFVEISRRYQLTGPAVELLHAAEPEPRS